MKYVKIAINNLTWKVYFVKNGDSHLEQNENEQNVCGITHFSDLKIYINKDINYDLIERTIRHELTHAYLFSYGMGQYETFTEENVCDIVETYGKSICLATDVLMSEFDEMGDING